MTQEQALQLSTLLYEAVYDLTSGPDVVAERLLALAGAIEANETTMGGIGDLRAYVATEKPAPVLKLVQ